MTMEEGNVSLPSFCELIPSSVTSSNALHSSAASALVTAWSVLPVNIQRLDLQATEHGKMVLPTPLPHFHPAAIRSAKFFIAHRPHLILTYRIIPDTACRFDTDSEARASPLQPIAHNVDQTGRVRLAPLSTNQT
jgi:hypothetical protein